MKIKEFAKSISGKEYGYPQFTKEEIETAQENGWVIVYGASDDLMEFEGCYVDEVGYFDNRTVYIDIDGISIEPICDGNKTIKSIWCGGETDESGNEITWTYETDIPHETFMIYEDGEPYCRGIVFSVDDIESKH